MPARSDHPGARGQRGDDARYLAAHRPRRQRNDGLATRRQRRTANEVHLTANAGEHLVTDGIGTDLAGQIDLDGRVDGDNLGIPTDDRSVVGPVAGIKTHQRIVVHEIKQLLRAVDETGDDASLAHLLEPVGDRTGFNQLDDAVGKHLRVDAEVLLVFHARQRRIRNATDAHLQGRTILHQIGNQLPDLGLHVRFRLGVMRLQRTVGGDESADPAEWHDVVAVGPRHLLVDLRDHNPRGIGGGLAGITGGAERAKAMRIRGRQLEDRHIQLHLTGEKKPGNIRQENGHKIRPTFLHRRTHGRPDEQRNGPEFLLAALLGKGSRTIGVQMIELHLFQIPPGRQGLYQRCRRRRSPVNVNIGGTANMRNRLRRSHRAAFVV